MFYIKYGKIVLRKHVYRDFQIRNKFVLNTFFTIFPPQLPSNPSIGNSTIAPLIKIHFVFERHSIETFIYQYKLKNLNLSEAETGVV